MHKKESQKKRILEHLQSGRSLTAYQCLIKFDSLRLSGRIYELRQEGYPIKMELIDLPNGKTIGKYSLESV